MPDVPRRKECLNSAEGNQVWTVAGGAREALRQRAPAVSGASADAGTKPDQARAERCGADEEGERSDETSVWQPLQCCCG